ncbi:MAG: fatty acid desaturase family protein [Steroidobacter sp.]
MNETSSIELRAKWCAPSDRYGWTAVLRNTTPYVLLIAVAPLLHQQWALAPWLLSPLIGLFAYRMTIVMHDCTHRTLFADPDLNVRVGKTLGAVAGIDFDRFSTQHWRHHRNYGAPEDPQGFHYANLRAMTRAEALWHMTKPLLGLNLRHTWSESFLHLRNLAHTIPNGEILLLAGMQTLIAAIVTSGGRESVLVLLPFVSTATFGLFFSQLRGVAEHATLRTMEAGHVRSHAPHWLDRILLYDLNFNLHEEHHRYPQCSSCHLPAVHQALCAAGGKLPRSMFRTIASILLTPRASSHGQS